MTVWRRLKDIDIYTLLKTNKIKNVPTTVPKFSLSVEKLTDIDFGHFFEHGTNMKIPLDNLESFEF